MIVVEAEKLEVEVEISEEEDAKGEAGDRISLD